MEEGEGDCDSIEEFEGTLKRARVKYKDGSFYDGPISKRRRLRHGKDGVLTLSDHSLVYSGRWENGHLVHGTVSFEELGISLTGPFDAQGLLTSDAALEKTSDYTFQGAFFENVKEGKGEQKFGCGLQIFGTWRGGALEGVARVVFPDQKTVMSCHFSKGIFEKGKLGRLVFDAQGEFPGKYPCQNDPYEDLYVMVGKSTIENAGEGLFAKIDIPSHFLVSYYNGCLVEHDVVNKVAFCEEKFCF